VCVETSLCTNNGIDKCFANSCNGTHCVSYNTTTCEPSTLCSTNGCNPSTGECESNPVICPDDNDFCTSVTCQPGIGCVTTNTTCTVPLDRCFVSTGCDPATGNCGTTQIDCDDGVFCTVDSCDSNTGCVHTPDDNLCDDPNPCTNYSQCLNLSTTFDCVSTPVDCGGQGLYCSNLTCVDFFGCSNEPRDCQGNATNGTCNTYNCSEVKRNCEKVIGVCFDFLGVVVGIVVGGIIGGVIAAAAFIAGLSAGGAAAAYSSSEHENSERAVKHNPLFQSQGQGKDVTLG